MSWFGGGSKKDDNIIETDSGFSDSSASYSSSPNMYGSGGVPGSSSGSSSGLQEFQDFSVALQQQVIVQTVITDLTHKAFSKCCTTSSSSSSNNTLTGKEAACISAVTNKWLDSNEYLVERIQRKQQQGGSQF